MTFTQFTEVDATEFSRQIAVNRYKYNFLVLEANNRFAVLHIADYEVCTLRRIDGVVVKQQTLLLAMLEGRKHRFFIEPRFDGVTVSRLVLKSPLRVGNICAVYRKPTEEDTKMLITLQDKDPLPTDRLWFLSPIATVHDAMDVASKIAAVETIASDLLGFPLKSVIDY